MGVHGGPHDPSIALSATIVSSSNATDTTYISGGKSYRVYTFLGNGIRVAIVVNYRVLTQLIQPGQKPIKSFK